MKNRIVTQIIDGLLLLVGSLTMALAYVLFLIPHKIVPGGATGISMVLNHFLATPIGLVAIAINIPLFVIGVRVLGKSYGVKSVIGMLLSALMIDFFTYLVPIHKATNDIILASIFGGILLGAGLGLVFRGGGSTGGSDIVGMLISRKTSLSTGSSILVVDFMIISVSGLAYGNFELALYGYLNLYLLTRVIDLVLEGVSFTRAVFIISDHSNTISQTIMRKMNRGATLLHGTGAYSQASKEVVFSVMSKKEVIQARQIVKQIDPNAFVTITEVYEVLGEGFRPRTEVANA